MLHHAELCSFITLSVSWILSLSTTVSSFTCSLPIFSYCSSVVAQSLPLLSVFIIIRFSFFILVCRLFNPFLSSSSRLLSWSPSLLQCSFLYSWKTLLWISLLISISASLFTLKGLGNVTLAHSTRSVALLLLSSYSSSIGSYTCRDLASSSLLALFLSSSSSSAFPAMLVSVLFTLYSAVGTSSSSSLSSILTKL